MTTTNRDSAPLDDWARQGPPILYGEAARAALLRGADQMASLIAPTLGPVARTVAIAPILGNDPPEILDAASTSLGSNPAWLVSQAT